MKTKRKTWGIPSLGIGFALSEGEPLRSKEEGIMKGTHLALLLAGTWLDVRAYRSVHRYAFRAKTVLITGGSRGLGLVLARQAAHEGARVAICARDPAQLQRAE